MTETQIYKQAITKAVANGFNYGFSSTWEREEIVNFLVYDAKRPDMYTVIFNHHFAKAFYGEESMCMHCGNDALINNYNLITCEKHEIQYIGLAYQFFLQDSVLRENPIKHLANFL